MVDAGRGKIIFEGDTSKVKGALKGVEGEAEGRGRKIGRKLAAGLAAVGAAAGTFRFLKTAVESASDLNEVISKTGEVFGDAAGHVTGFADKMADAFGIPKQEMLDAASNIGLIAKGAGLAEDEAAKMSTNMAQLAADASSFFNVPVPEALEKIRAGLTGEAEPLKQFGVLLNAAAVEAEAAALGIAKPGEALTEQQKVMARASVITKGMADASGDLARTQDSVANRMKAVQGAVQNIVAEAGSALLPVMQEVLGVVSDLLPALQPVIEALVTALSPALKLVGTVIEQLAPIIGGIIRAFAPFVALVLEVAGALLGGLLQALKPVIEGLLTGLTPVLKVLSQLLAEVILPTIAELTPIWAELGEVAGEIFAVLLRDVLVPVLIALMPLIKALIPVLLSMLPAFVEILRAVTPVVELLADLLNLALHPIKAAIGPITSLVEGLAGGFNKVSEAVAAVIRWFGRVIDRIKGFKLPGWLTKFLPGSPPPLAQGLSAVAAQLRAATFEFERLAAVVNGPSVSLGSLAGAGAGGAQPIQVNVINQLGHQVGVDVAPAGENAVVATIRNRAINVI